MRLIYLLLSPTFGMHQYTADLANRLAAEPGMEVHLVTTASLPRDRYSPAVRIHAPVLTHGTGFSREGLDPNALRRILRTVDRVAGGKWQVASGRWQAASGRWQAASGRWQAAGGRWQVATCNLQPATCNLQPATCNLPPATVIHLPAVHLWNPALVRALRRRGLPVIHTLHDLDPHVGVRFAPLIRLWNRLIIRWADRLLVHGQVYRRRLLAMGVAPGRVTAVPLLHGCLSYTHSGLPAALADHAVTCEPWALFFGRLEEYKGVGMLLEAAALAAQDGASPMRLLLAGQGELGGLWEGPLPAGVEVRPRRIDDAEAIDLFRRCGLLVLPYLDATQSALVAAAYAFRKPVLVTQTGALPEYVQHGVTGWVVPPGDPAALARALQTALADPSRLAAMGQAGWQWYQQQRHEEYQTLLDLYRF